MRRKEYRALYARFAMYGADHLTTKELEKFYNELYDRAQRLRTRLLWLSDDSTDDAKKNMKRNLHDLIRAATHVINELNYESDGRNAVDMRRHCIWLTNVVNTLATL